MGTKGFDIGDIVKLNVEAEIVTYERHRDFGESYLIEVKAGSKRPITLRVTAEELSKYGRKV